jgi:hypothetical protein
LRLQLRRPSVSSFEPVYAEDGKRKRRVWLVEGEKVGEERSASQPSAVKAR